jgi:glycosyltransferase involved in cell wall biosynthesis
MNRTSCPSSVRALRVRHALSHARIRPMTKFQTLVDTAIMGSAWVRLERPPLRVPHRATGRHLALFARALPPHSDGGVYRPLSFIQYGCQRGWRVDAFCGEAPDAHPEAGRELLARVPAEADLHIVASATREPSYRFFPRVDGGFANALEYARHAIAVLASRPPDCVLASGPPFFTFVAALFVARHFRVPLVLDYRDEWTECPFDFVTKDRHDRAWERRCLQKADAVIFTTRSHLQHQLATFPELDPRKAHVVPNGWEPDDFMPGTREARSDASDAANGLSLAHVGHLAAHTAPDDFLESLAQLLTDEPAWQSQLKVQLVGRRSFVAERAVRAFRFPNALEIVDHVGKREANRRMQASDVLVLIARADLERYLPGKLFDYLAARRPILVFGERGEASALIEQLGAGVRCPPGSGAMLRDALTHLHALDMSRNEESVGRWLQQHRRDVLASRVFGIIESLSKR